MRTIKELLIILRDSIELLETGLCLICLKLMLSDSITEAEYNYIHDYIYDNRPSKKSKLYGNSDANPYYWDQGDKEPRLRWLNYHIKKNKL